MNRASTYWSEPEHGALVEELHEPAVQVLDAAASDDLVGVDVHPSEVAWRTRGVPLKGTVLSRLGSFSESISRVSFAIDDEG